jgi:hypothetical protein
MRAKAISVCGLKLLVYEGLSYWCMRAEATSVCGLKLLVYEALSD